MGYPQRQQVRFCDNLSIETQLGDQSVDRREANTARFTFVAVQPSWVDASRSCRRPAPSIRGLHRRDVGALRPRFRRLLNCGVTSLCKSTDETTFYHRRGHRRGKYVHCLENHVPNKRILTNVGVSSTNYIVDGWHSFLSRGSCVRAFQAQWTKVEIWNAQHGTAARQVTFGVVQTPLA